MNELQILTGATVTGVVTLLLAVGGWLGKLFTGYINERDKFRDQIHSLQVQIEAQVRVTNQQDTTIKGQDATIVRLEATITGLEETVTKLEATIAKLETTIKELTLDKATAERERDAALRGEPEPGERGEQVADVSIAATPDMGEASTPKGAE